MGSEMLFLGHKPEKMMKSNFTQTCSRFSQFLKERRSLGQLEIKGAKDVSGTNCAARNLFPKNNNISMEKEKMSLELFPLGNSTKDMAGCRELPLPKEEPKNATAPSMTIFYGGRVLIFNELPEDKAREIMSLASRGTSNFCSQNEIEPKTSHNINNVTTHLAHGVTPSVASSLSDLPIARRVSLHRFMEKRKHRIAANAPYQHKNSSMAMDDSHSRNFNMEKSLYDQQQLELKL